MGPFAFSPFRTGLQEHPDFVAVVFKSHIVVLQAIKDRLEKVCPSFLHRTISSILHCYLNVRQMQVVELQNVGLSCFFQFQFRHGMLTNCTLFEIQKYIL